MNWEVEPGRERPDQSRRDLAAELKKLILSLDADGAAAETGPHAPAAIHTEHRDPESGEITAQIQELRALIEETNAELILAVRLLRELTHAGIADLSDQLAETEQRLRNEINAQRGEFGGPARRASPVSPPSTEP